MNERLNPKLKKDGKDFEYYKEEIASFPTGVVVITHSQNGQSFKKLLNTFQEIVQPSKKVTNKIQKLLAT